jgi:hypothetical protein
VLQLVPLINNSSTAPQRLQKEEIEQMTGHELDTAMQERGLYITYKRKNDAADKAQRLIEYKSNRKKHAHYRRPAKRLRVEELLHTDREGVVREEKERAKGGDDDGEGEGSSEGEGDGEEEADHEGVANGDGKSNHKGAGNSKGESDSGGDGDDSGESNNDRMEEEEGEQGRGEQDWPHLADDDGDGQLAQLQDAAQISGTSHCFPLFVTQKE